MKILTISNMYPSKMDPYYGTFVRNVYEHLVKSNQEGINDLVVIRGRSYSKFAKTLKYLKFYCLALYKMLYNKYDLIYVHTISYTIIPIKIASVFKRLPLVFNVHGGDVITNSKKIVYLRDIAGSMMGQIKMLVCPSQYFKEVCLITFPLLSSDKVFISPSGGIDKKFFVERKVTNSNVLNLGYVSRIDKDKGYDVMMEAIKILIKEGLPIKASIIGRGSEEGKLTEYIKNNSLSSYIQFWGPKSQDELPAYYASFDCFIFPTLAYESLGLVGIEAMAAGTPVISSNIGGPGSYICNGVNGFKFIPGDAQDMADKIKVFYNLSPYDRKNLSYNCIRFAQKFESNLVFNELNKKLQELCC